jgi:hypothetical protein
MNNTVMAIAEKLILVPVMSLCQEVGACIGLI